MQVGPTAGADVLVLLLEEVIYSAEVLGVVPVTVELAETDDGGVAGSFETVPVGSVEIIGPAPKGVAREVSFEHGNGAWRCRALVDV